jgi:gamma-glutamyltranspeptidase / glutathione hydrolase
VEEPAPLSGFHRGAEVHTAGEVSGGRRLLDMLAYDEANLTPGAHIGAETWIAYAKGLDAAFETHKRKVGLDQKAGCTSHMSAVDAEGNMVALTYTLLNRFGSGVVLPSTGLLMNNSVAYFDPRPGNPVSIAGGKRINSSNMCPTIATRDGEALFAVGASGANHIVPCTAQLTALLLDYGMSLEEAFHTPRIDASARGSVRADPRMGEAALTELRKHFALEVAQQLVFPKLYSCPSGVARDADGLCWGISDVSQPVAGAATPAPFTLEEEGVKAQTPRA